ncbi:MAG TPA: AzlD domain-containing protein [Ktedonobacterales bacterium]|nr:AzlD domain-containing protein [Ktedonobacterales bacterium]
MSRTGALVIVILVVGAGTYLLRAVPLALGSRATPAAAVARWLSYVTPATLGALLGPLLLMPEGALLPPWANAALLAAIPTAAVARLSRSLLATIAAGVILYAAIGALLAWVGASQ